MNPAEQPTQPDVAGADLLDDLQTQIGELLTALATLLPLVNEFKDTHNPDQGLGFVTPEGLEAQNHGRRAERAATAKRLKASRIATWSPGVDIVDVGPGASPSPGNVGGISSSAEVAMYLHHHARFLINLQARSGICTLIRVPSDPTVEQLLHAVRQLVWQTTSMRHLEAIRRDLEWVRDQVLEFIDGPARRHIGMACPYCGQPTLVLVAKEDLIECDRHPKSTIREPCVCPDPLCECKTRPVAYRHKWYRTKRPTWQSLEDRLTLERNTR